MDHNTPQTKEQFSEQFDITLDPAPEIPLSTEQIYEVLARPVHIPVLASDAVQPTSDTEPDGSEDSDVVDNAVPASVEQKKRRRLPSRIFFSLALAYSAVTAADIAVNNFAEADCIEPAKDVDMYPDMQRTLDAVNRMHFVENDIERLHKVQADIADAPTIDRAQEVAQKYLVDLGLPVHMNEVPSVSLRRLYSQPFFNGFSLVEPKSGSQELRRALQDLVLAIASTPTKRLQPNGAKDIYIVQAFEDEATAITLAQKRVLFVLPQDSFMLFSLDALAQNPLPPDFLFTPADLAWNHELEHIRDASQCDRQEADLEFRSLNPDDFNYYSLGEEPLAEEDQRAIDDFVVAEAYARTKTIEDKAVTMADFMAYGVSPEQSARGQSPLARKGKLLIGREIADTGFTELPEYINFRRIYGSLRHPLEILDQNYAPFVDAEWKPGYELGMDIPHVAETAFGNILMHCSDPEDDSRGRIMRCGASVTAALAETYPVDPEESWYANVRSVLEGAAAEVMGTDRLTEHGAVVEEPDENFPQLTTAQFVFYRNT